MSMYGDEHDLPPSELELEEERAGYTPPDTADPDEALNSDMWIAGIGPSGRRLRESTPDEEADTESPD